MQKVINILAVLSFVGTAGIIGAGTAVYLQRESIIEGVKEQAMDAVTDALPGIVGGLTPELPGATGGALPMPTTTGPALPF
jgi:hypothetical protein|tara:strand:- start:1047 stop:1289 length:243 start_codon:yes stop_codon:yes gene_type:complete